jgi:hypothetical protein
LCKEIGVKLRWHDCMLRKFKFNDLRPSRLVIILAAMNSFCQTHGDLASLHYIAFIEPLAGFPTEVVSFNSQKFTSTSINKMIEAETKDPFPPSEEHFFVVVLVYKKPYEVQFEDLLHEYLEFFSKP